VVSDIKQSYKYYSALAAKRQNIEVRKILSGIPQFFPHENSSYCPVSFIRNVGMWSNLAMPRAVALVQYRAERVRASLECGNGESSICGKW
jgi:hypothetical protein